MTTGQQVPSGGAGQAETGAGDMGQELVSKAQAQAQQTARELRGEAGFQLREQVNQRSTEAGEQIVSVSDALRKSSEQLRTDGMDAPARAVEQMALRADELGSYLRSADADRILGDVESFARRRPWLVAAAGALAGLAASRFLTASSDRRYESSGYPSRTRLAPRERALPSGGS